MRKKLFTQHNIQSLFTTPSVQYLFAAQTAAHRAIIISNRTGNYQLHAVDFQADFHRQITNTKHGMLFGSISSDGQYIFFLNDKNGVEHGHFICLPFEGKGGIDITPNLKPYFSYSVSTNNNIKLICFTAAVDNKNRVFVVIKNKKGDYCTREIYKTTNLLSEPICAPDGSLVCVAETDARKRKSRLIFLSVSEKKVKTVHLQQFKAVIPLAFSQVQNKKVVLALVRRNTWYRPVMYDITRRCFTEIHHSLFRGDVWVLFWDEKYHQLVLCDVYHAEQKLYIYNTHTTHLKRIGPNTGSFNFHFGSVATSKNRSFIVRWSDFNTPPCLITIHAPQYNTWNKIPEWSGKISSHYEIKKIYTKSSNREKVQLWVIRPHVTKKPIPFVIDIHGGPHDVVFDEFSPEAHAWLRSGFGYCAVNYRGSIGFGRKFEQKIYGNPGYWEVEDVVAARNWLVENGYADPKYITLYGWSWGGYVVLLALGKYPKLWNSGIAGAGIADSIMQYEDEPEYFKAQDKERFKGTPKNARARYIRSSPLTYVKNIQSPLLILHGKYDIRCTPRQIKNFVSTLKKNKKQFEVKWFKSGHIGEFTDTNLRVSLIKRSIKFALKSQK
jgi:dienelactone hydrolase